MSKASLLLHYNTLEYSMKYTLMDICSGSIGAANEVKTINATKQN